MRIGADGFEIVLVSEIRIRCAREAIAENVAHGSDNVFLPQKTVPATGPEVAEAQARNAAQAFHLFPEPGLGARKKNVELELGEQLHAGARSQLVDDRERVNLPKCRLGPQPMEAQR